MRLLPLLAVSLLLLAACGDDDSPVRTGVTLGPGLPAAERTTAAPVTPSPTPVCDGPLPGSSAVKFQGEVTSVEPLPEGWTRIYILLERVDAHSGISLPEGVNPEVGEVIPVIRPPGDLPVLAREGDCILGSARLRRYACGPACDAVGLVADVLIVD